MKNMVKHLLHLTLILLPASFVARVSVPAATPGAASPAARGESYGGAFVIFAGKYGGEITRKEIEGHSGLQVDGCAKGSRIFQFTLSVTKNGKTNTLTSRTGLLTGEMTTLLKSLRKGDTFEFQHTKACLPDSNEVVDVRGKMFIVV